MTSARHGPHADLVLRVAGCGALPETAVDLTPTVDLSWRRCLYEFKLDPARDYQPAVLDRSRVKDLHAEHQDLVEIARAEMDSLYEQISESGYALLLADTDGVILCEKVEPTLKEMFNHAGGLRLLGAAGRGELVGRSITDVFDASYEELPKRNCGCTLAMTQDQERRDTNHEDKPCGDCSYQPGHSNNFARWNTLAGQIHRNTQPNT